MKYTIITPQEWLNFATARDAHAWMHDQPNENRQWICRIDNEIVLPVEISMEAQIEALESKYGV